MIYKAPKSQKESGRRLTRAEFRGQILYKSRNIITTTTAAAADDDDNNNGGGN